ncbi:MAG: NAD-dependent epimerase/dehydratase family protein [Solirubrobacterales bacterium]
MSRVLVTGATGFIGSHALRALEERGHEVDAVTADLLDPGTAEEIIRAARPTHLLHLAWYAVPGKFWTAPENEAWVEATLRLLRDFYAAGGERAVGAGTCAEYDWTSGGLLSETDTPLRPATLYGRAKAETFTAASELGELAWGRIFFLYGPREHPDRLVSSVARRLLAGEEAQTSAGTQVRDFMHVADVAAAFAALVDSDVTGAVNIGSGEPVTVRAVVEEVARATGRHDLLRVGALPQREGEPAELVADVRRLRDEAGFEPRYDLRSGIADTVAWWRRAQR